jgi:hypothetical protein
VYRLIDARPDASVPDDSCQDHEQGPGFAAGWRQQAAAYLDIGEVADGLSDFPWLADVIFASPH